MILRARWLRSLDPDERDSLGDLPLREVDALFDTWREAVGDFGDDAE